MAQSCRHSLQPFIMVSTLALVSVVAFCGFAAATHKIDKRQNLYYQEPEYHQQYQDYQQPYQQYQPLVAHRPLRQKEKEEQQDLSKLPGVPGVDYPLYHEVPHTSFDCSRVPAVPGMYADVEAGCQAYHVCQEDREGYKGGSFLCTNGTLFNQKEFTCDWWYNVNCNETPQFYSLNLDPIKNPYAPKPKHPEEPLLEPETTYHGRAYNHHL